MVHPFIRFSSCATLAITLALSATVGAESSPKDGERQEDLSASVIKLSPHTEVSVGAGAKVETLPSIPLTAAGVVGPVNQFRLLEGSTEVSVQQGQSTFDVRIEGDRLLEVPTSSGRSAVLIRSPKNQLALIVHGRATARVIDGQLSVINHEGRTLVGTSNSMQPLSPGSVRSFGCSEGEAARPLIPHPTISPGKRLWTSLETATVRPDSISWSKVPRAALYRVSIDQLDRPGFATRFDIQGTNLAEQAPEMPPGHYSVSVQSIDACRVFGHTSPPTSFRIVGVSVPRGSYLEKDGTIRTIVGSGILFSHTSGIQMSYPGTDSWISVPERMTLRRDREEQVLFRTDDGSLATIKIGPRDIHARVQMSPRNAVWPDQDIDVTVELQRGNDLPVPNWVEPTIKTMVGVEPVPVMWKRTGSTLRASIPPQPGVGPWVIRVEVEDQFGLPLGRGFMEISHTSS